MTSVIIVGLIAGYLAAAGLVAFTRGALGKKHVAPFGISTPSSPMINVFIGWLSVAIAAIIWHLVPMRQHPRAAFLAVAVGVLVAGWIAATRSKAS